MDSSCGCTCGLEILLQCPRRSARGKEGDCRASWKYELTKGREVLPSTSLCPSASGKAWLKILLSLYLPHSSLHLFLSPSLYFSISPFISFSLYTYILPLCSLIQELTLHTQEKTEISIHVLPHSLATPTNGSMQLACTHSKRPFEYSSANSCIHWYLKCSGSARALNSRYIWLNLKKEQRRISGTRIKTVFIVQQHQIPSGKLRLACVCVSSTLRKWKHVHCQSSLRPTDNNLQCT